LGPWVMMIGSRAASCCESCQGRKAAAISRSWRAPREKPGLNLRALFIFGEVLRMKFRNMATVYLRRGEELLLLYRTGSRVVGNSWIGTAGGHFEKDELNDPRACVLRELYEETGLTEADIANLAQRYITLRLKNGEVRQNHYFFADLKPHVRSVASNEGDLRWFAPDETAELNMPASARHMFDHYLAVGRHDDILRCGTSRADGTDFVPMEEF